MISSVQLSNITPQLNFGQKKLRRGPEGHYGVQEDRLTKRQFNRALHDPNIGKYTNALQQLVSSNKPPEDLSLESVKRWLKQVTNITATDVLNRLAAKLPEVVQKRKAA
jgi:hypothetical protein